MRSILLLLCLFAAVCIALRMNTLDVSHDGLGFCKKKIFFKDGGSFLSAATARGDVLYSREMNSNELFDCAPDEKFVFATDSVNSGSTLQKLSSTNLETIKTRTFLNEIVDLKVSPSGRLFVVVDIPNTSAGTTFQVEEYNYNLKRLQRWNLDVFDFSSIAVDPEDNLYVFYENGGEDNANRIRKLTTSGTFIEEIQLPHMGEKAVITEDVLVMSADDGLYVYDRLNDYQILWSYEFWDNARTAAYGNLLAVVDSDEIIVCNIYSGAIKYKWGDDDENPRSFYDIISIEVRTDGNVAIADSEKGHVTTITPSGKIKTNLVFDEIIRYFSFRPTKNQLYIKFDEYDQRVKRYSQTGKFLSTIFTAAGGPIKATASGSVLTWNRNDEDFFHYSMSGAVLGTNPVSDVFDVRSMAQDSKGKIYVIDDESALVRVYSSSLSFKKQWGGAFPLVSLRFIYIDSTDRVYIIDYKNIGVHVYTLAGEHLFSFGQLELFNPTRMAVTPKIDSQKRFIYVVDDEDQVVKFTYSGKYLTRWFS